MEDLWQAAFPIGTEWDNMDKLREINWDFSNLEKTFEEGGPLRGKTVYLFGSTEPQLLNINGQNKITLIPIVVAVDSPVPPSDKIGIKSVQRETEDIIPMKAMKMAWIPYVPLENRLLQVELLQKKKMQNSEKTQIYTLGCTQRRSALQNLKIERIKQFDYCLPYLQPLKPDEDENDTVVNIMYPIEPPVVCDFDWELDELEQEFVDDLIKDERLAEDQKDAFKDFVKQQVREKKKAQREAKEARENAIRNMDEKTRSALENMKVYKFYPVSTPDTPDISSVKAGGPFYDMPKGRKDGRRSKIEDTIRLLAPVFNSTTLIKVFSQHGFTAQELVAFSIDILDPEPKVATAHVFRRDFVWFSFAYKLAYKICPCLQWGCLSECLSAIDLLQLICTLGCFAADLKCLTYAVCKILLFWSFDSLWG